MAIARQFIRSSTGLLFCNARRIALVSSSRTSGSEHLRGSLPVRPPMGQVTGVASLFCGGDAVFSSWAPSGTRKTPAEAVRLQSIRRVAFSSTCARKISREEKQREGRPPRASSHPDKPQKTRLKVLEKFTPHENIYTVPNILTFSRFLAAPIIGYLIVYDYHAWAVGLFAYAGLTDLLDGFIARRWNLRTVVGTIIDPLADKTLMTILTVCLSIKGTVPVWLAAIILGRDVGLGIAAIYYRWISLPPPKTFSRYWDFSLPSAEVRPTLISKCNTVLQLALIGATTVMPLLKVDISAGMSIMQYLVAVTTIWSGASYIFTKDAVRILSQAELKRNRDSITSGETLRKH